MKKFIILFLCLLFAGNVFAAELCITIPDAKVDRVLDGMCGRYEYDPNVGVTKNQFVKQKVRKFIRNSVLVYEYNQARNVISLEALTLDPNSL